MKKQLDEFEKETKTLIVMLSLSILGGVVGLAFVYAGTLK